MKLRNKRRRKPNARYVGTDWDNDRGGDVDMSTQESQDAQKMARPQDRPKLKDVVEVPQHLLNLDDYPQDENSDPNLPGRSARSRVRKRVVTALSDDEWQPPEDDFGDSSTEEEVEEDESAVEEEELLEAQRLMPEERRRARPRYFRKNREGLGDAQGVTYLDHGERSETCAFCQARLYKNEVVKRKGYVCGGSLCCHAGKAASLSNHFDEPAPEPLQWLFNDYTSARGKAFHNNIRYINSALQMASSTAKVRDRGGPGMMVAEGNIYHLMNPLETSEDPQYVQLYMIDDQAEELAARIKRLELKKNPKRHHRQRERERKHVEGILGMLQDTFHTCNPYVREFKSVFEQVRENREAPLLDFEVKFIENDRKVYNEPQASEVMAVVDDKEDAKEKRGLRLLARNRVNCKKPVTIWDCSPLYEPLHFVLFYPQGTCGWHADIGLTPQQYGVYWLHDRPGMEVHANFTRGGRLFQEWVVDTYVKVERQRLNYFKSDEFRTRMRRSALGHLQQAVREGKRKGSEAGTQAAEVPASHIGSRAYFRKKRYDAYALARAHGNPSLFITMTCNPSWPEITKELERGQTPEDRPDIISRVFHIKMQQLKNDILRGKTFGKAKALTYRVEFQKRGLPHVHMLVWLEDEALTKTGIGIEQVSRAWIPNPSIDQYGFDLVSTHMMHECKEGRCLKNGKCKDHYPMAFRDEITVPNPKPGGGYPIYRRPTKGEKVVKKKKRRGKAVVLDNRHTVPYNMYLLKRYNCHLNVMVCSGIEGIKYMFKYVYKEPSRANVALSEKSDGDEAAEMVDHFFDGLCIGSAEACWRLYGFELAGSYPNVLQLHVHTPDNQNVLFEEEGDLESAVDMARSADTKLTAWFKFNADQKREYEARMKGKRTGRHAATRPLALSTCYADIGSIATWDATLRRWKPRKNHTRCVGRLPFVHPRDKERWCLKQLLCGISGATCWDDLRTVSKEDDDDVVCSTFEDACRERGMLENDDLWCIGMDEAIKEGMPCQLRTLFVELLTFCNIADPFSFWNRYKTSLSEDYLYEVDARLMENPDDPIADTVAEDEYGRWSWRAVLDIQELLEESRKTLRECGIPEPPEDLISTEVEKEVRAYHNFSYQDIEANISKLNSQQRAAFDQIAAAVQLATSGENVASNVFFLDGVGGSGKTFLYKTILMKVRQQSQEESERSERPVAIAMASNGLPAQLLPNGTTVHRRFRLPVTDDFESQQLMCAIPRESQMAEVLRRARLIVWDEAPTLSKWHLDAVDRCLRDVVKRPDRLMGGKVVVLGGDFRQCGPVLKNSKGVGRRAAEVNASLTHWNNWGAVKILRLHINMRVQNCLNPDRKQGLDHWSRWLKCLGDGAVPLNTEGRFIVPSSLAFIPTSQDPQDREKEFFEHMYSEVRNKDGEERDEFLKGTAVLVPKNDTADRVNDQLLDALIDGHEHLYVSINGTTDPEHQRDDAYPEEYLASIKDGSLPAHVIRLRVGAPIIALRNITKGVYNGTRMVVTKLLQYSITARVLHGPRAGQEIPISRVEVTQDMGSFELKRCQLPIRVAFAMTINKAQGLTLKRVGVYLIDDVFSHGQLYVALSRCGDDQNIWVFGPEPDEEQNLWTKNVVYKEVLIDR